MPLSLECPSCAKKLKVPDEWAGKKVKCPGCGTTFPAAAGGGVAVAAAPATRTAASRGGAAPPANYPTTSRVPKVSEPKFAISGGMLIMSIVLLCIVAGILTFIYGPVAAQKKWDAVSQQANDDVTDVTARAMEAYLSNNGVNLRKAHSLPQVREVGFFPHIMVRKLPDWTDFRGTTTQGEFKGRYNIETREVEEDLELGGLTFAGLDKAVVKGGTKIHVTGRKKGNDVTVEINGKPMQVVYPKPGSDDE